MDANQEQTNIWKKRRCCFWLLMTPDQSKAMAGQMFETASNIKHNMLGKIQGGGLKTMSMSRTHVHMNQNLWCISRLQSVIKKIKVINKFSP